MKRAVLVSLLVGALASPALAAPPTVMVLRTEGRADGKTRAKIDAALLHLATSTAAQASPGDITFTDATAAVGCEPETQACRDQVIEMLAVDEIVYATVSPKPGGLEVEVHRVTRGSTRDGKMLLASGASPDKLDGIAPLFGGAAPATTEPVTATKPTTTTRPATPAKPAVAVTATTSATTETTASEPVTTEPAPLPTASEPTAPVVTTPAPTPGVQADVAPRRPNTRLQIAGMAGGGAMVLLGFILWGEAASIQEEVDNHPTATRKQLEDLAALERRGDSYAGWGNVMFIGGAVLGGISTYYFVKGRKARRATQTARIAPALIGHGAGFTLTFGGSQ